MVTVIFDNIESMDEKIKQAKELERCKIKISKEVFKEWLQRWFDPKEDNLNKN